MKKKVVPIVALILIIGILFSVFGTPRYQSIRITNGDFAGLKNKLKEAVNTNNEVDIKELADFDWDECYVFPPTFHRKKFIKE